MTLTAIDSEHKLFSPWAMLCQGIDEATIRLEMIDVQQEGGFFCPHCFQSIGELVPVRYRSGSENRRPHFFHKSEEGSDRQCANHSGESERHFNAKTWIAENLRRKGQGKNVRVEVDRLYLRSLDGRKRKPDILEMYGNGSKIAHEIQVSPISLDLLKLRTEDLLNECGIVVWWLYRSVYRDEIRSYLAALPSVQFNHFWFSEEDFKFCEGSAPEADKKKKQPSGSDRCSYSGLDRETFLRQQRAEQEQRWTESQVRSIEQDENQALFDWFLSLEESQLIPPPFHLYPHMRILGNKFYETLRSDAEEAIAGEKPPRLRTGALIKDLKRLKELIDEQSSTAPEVLRSSA